MDDNLIPEPLSGSHKENGKKETKDCSDINSRKHSSFIQVDDPIDERDELKYSAKKKSEKKY